MIDIIMINASRGMTPSTRDHAESHGKRMNTYNALHMYICNCRFEANLTQVDINTTIVNHSTGPAP
jgi:hypothetical protein